MAKGNPKEPRETTGDVIDGSYTGNKLHPTQKYPYPCRSVETFSVTTPRALVRLVLRGARMVVGRSFDVLRLVTQTPFH